MTTQLHIRQNDDAPLVIAVHEDEMVEIRLVTHPRAKTGERPAPTFSVTGLRWRGGRHFHLGWVEHPLTVGTSLHLDYVAKDDPVSALAKDQEYIAPEPQCGFCGRASSQVEVLIKRRHIHYICDRCVRECQSEIDARRAERDR